ncbi:MAG TPA: ABC transporter ATP-binding protein [Thermoanaerobaculia bacterium]|nr:ABC transporter ATP-binding protein [Thermoanaerobaculia bacterium]
MWALRDVSFEIGRGEAVGLIGGNGAGKSTLLKILSRITEPTTGEARIEGRVGSLLEVGTGFHSELSGRENVYLAGAILGMKRAEITRKLDEIVAFAEVERFLDTPVKRYSSGMYLRLAFAVAAHLEPEILLVDEVLAVGDAAFQKKCLGKMGDVARQGRTVLFVSHNMVAIEGLCQRVLWLRDGRVAEDGPAGRVVSEYLKTSSAPAPERLWCDRDTAPGNEKVRLRSARVRPASGSPGDPVTVRTPLVFEFEYWNLQPGARLNLSLHLYNEQGVLVFNAGPLDPPPSFPAGLFRDVCQVPGDFLNDGVHSVELMVVQDLGKVLFRIADLLVFDVRDTVEMRGEWYGKWPGAVRPLLPWSTEAVEVPVEEPA